MNSWVLEIDELLGKHTSTAIAASLDVYFTRWQLDKAKCFKFLRDGAANGTKTCEEISVSHVSCIAHLPRLVVSAGLIKKKDQRLARSLLDMAETEEEIMM